MGWPGAGTFVCRARNRLTAGAGAAADRNGRANGAEPIELIDTASVSGSSPCEGRVRRGGRAPTAA
jgi:hypothetical protein